jgi:hypothetical protein
MRPEAGAIGDFVEELELVIAAAGDGYFRLSHTASFHMRAIPAAA